MSKTLAAFLLLYSAAAVFALPNGAPSCVSGDANVQSLHLDPNRNPRTGEIFDNGFDVFLDGKLIKAGTIESPTMFEAHVDHNITVKSNRGEKFRGILLLLHQVGVDVHLGEGLLPFEPLKEAIGCGGTPISGVTHSENSMKGEATALLHYDNSDGIVTLDVNIVIANNDRDGSAYFFSEYRLRAIEGTGKHEDERCGLFGRSIFCPLTLCGLLGRFLGLCVHEE